MNIYIHNINIAEITHATADELAITRKLLEQYSRQFHGKKFVLKGPFSVLWADRYFPVGMLSVLNSSDEIKLTINADNWKQFDITLQDLIDFANEYSMPFMPYEYQFKFAWYPIRFGRAFCVGATSSGKTFISFISSMYALQNKLVSKVLIVVPSIILVEQFADDYEEYFADSELALDLKVFRIHSEAQNKHKISDCQVVVSTFQSLNNINEQKFFDLFDYVYLDEAHHVHAKSMINIVAKTKECKIRLGMTGTLPGDKLHQQNMFSYIGYHFDTYSAKELIEDGRATKIVIHPIVFDHNQQFSDEFANRLLEPHKPDQIDNPDKNIDIKQAVLSMEQLYVMESEKRNATLAKLVCQFDKNILILSKRVHVVHEIARHIDDYCKANGIDKEIHVIAGGTNRSTQSRDAIKAKVESTTTSHIIVANMDIFATGVSYKALFFAFFVNIGKSDIGVIQGVGRLMRLHEKKDKAVLFDVADKFNITNNNPKLYPYKRKKSYLYDHQLNRLRMYKNEGHEIRKKHVIQV